MSSCICTDELLRQHNVCKQCNTGWYTNMDPFTRRSRCPILTHRPDLLSNPDTYNNAPFLCINCIQHGYFIDEFTGNVKQGKCTCNNDIYETKICGKCKLSFNKKLPYHLCVSRCPIHTGSIAICGGSYNICDTCK
jgi:hypothetical protein